MFTHLLAMRTVIKLIVSLDSNYCIFLGFSAISGDNKLDIVLLVSILLNRLSEIQSVLIINLFELSNIEFNAATLKTP